LPGARYRVTIDTTTIDDIIVQVNNKVLICTESCPGIFIEK